MKRLNYFYLLIIQLYIYQSLILEQDALYKYIIYLKMDLSPLKSSVIKHNLIHFKNA